MKDTSNEYVWTCDFCGKEFETKKESDKHELKCVKRPENSRVIVLRIPSQTNIFWGVMTILIMYILSFLLINSYAESNGLSKRSMVKPLEWFGAKPTPTNTPSPTPTSTPIPTKKATSKQQTSTTSSSGNIECIGPDGKHFNTSMAECEKLNKAWNKPVNYMTDCNLSSNCGGGTRKMSKIECNAGTCCQIGSSWSYYPSEQSCRDAQNKSSSGSSEASNKLYEVPFFQEKYSCRGTGLEDFVTYQKLWTENMKIANELGVMNTEANYYLELADGYMKKWKETLARYCTKI